MRRLFYTFVLLLICSAVYAQQLTVKAVNLRMQDARARTNPREDGQGKKCAIIRVGVVGFDDLVFPDAVGNVEHSLSEYIIYVPGGQKALQYNNKSGQKLGIVNFDDYGLEVKSMSSYDVIFESDNHLRSAIFSIQPKNAHLTFDGENVPIDKNGIAMINKTVGDYEYMVSCTGYEDLSGTVSLIEDSISKVTDVILQPKSHPVVIQVLPEDASVFIDNVPYTTANRKDLKLSEGKHTIRVTAENHKEEERKVNVKESLPPIIFKLEETKEKIIKHKEERSRTSANIRNGYYSKVGIEGIFPNKNSDAILWGPKIDFSYVYHFGRLFAMRTGLGGSLLSNDYEEDSPMYLSVDIPLQLGISVPLGKYNQHLFSTFAGGYGRGIFLISGHDEAEDYGVGLDENLNFDFGLRASFKLDISKFTIGADVAKSLNGYGFSGALLLGIKFYKISEK